MSIPPLNFTVKLHPHPKAHMFFKYPPGGLLQLQGIINEAELHSPTMLNKNGEACLFVLQNGNATGATIGHATGIELFV